MVTLLAVSACNALLPFMSSGVGVALPTIGYDLGANARQLGLVETAYFLSLSIFMLAAGRLGDIYGRRRLFQTGLATFTLMGGAISLVSSIEAVIVLRFLQGLGGAMMAATGMAIVVSIFSPNERGKALGILVATGYAGISCGPFIGGALVSRCGWRSLFYFCVPLGVSAFLVLRAKLRAEWVEAAGEPFDWIGSLTYGAAVSMLLLGAANATYSLWALGLLTAGLAVLVLFAVVEIRVPHPVLDIRLLWKNRILTLSAISTLLVYAATFGVTFCLSLYLQYVKGFSPGDAGTLLMVQPVAQSLLSPICGRLADRHAAERVATVGMVFCALGLGMTVRLTATTPLYTVMLALTLFGIGFALFASPNNSVMMGCVSGRHLGVVSALSGTMRTLGMMFSMTTITAAISVFMGDASVTPDTQPLFLSSIRVALQAFCALCGLGILCSLGRWRDAAMAREVAAGTRL